MSNLFRANKAGGGKLQETILWTNSAPTSSFAAQSVTLSESMKNFDYIKIKFRYSTNNATTLDVITPVNEILGTNAAGAQVPLVSLGGRGQSNRGLRTLANNANATTVDETHLYFSTTIFQNGTTDNTGFIPLEISGLQYAADTVKSYFEETITPQTIVNKIFTIGFKPKKLIISRTGNGSDVGTVWYLYDEDYSTTQFREFSGTRIFSNPVVYTIGASNALIKSIDDNGFTTAQVTYPSACSWVVTALS